MNFSAMCGGVCRQFVGSSFVVLLMMNKCGVPETSVVIILTCAEQLSRVVSYSRRS